MLPLQIFTHRGLEPARADFYSESTIEAFKDQLKRGFGLEIDLNFTKDGIVLWHDANLKRMTQGKDKRLLKELTTQEACEIRLPNGRLGTFKELMHSVVQYPHQMLAMHFKGSYQTSANVDRLIESLSDYEDNLNQLLVFDVIPSVANCLKTRFPGLQIGASVSHSYDIERYQKVTQGTLLSVDEFLNYRDLYTWAWLDEWDLVDASLDGMLGTKKLYTQEVFDLLRSNRYKISLVTPELHATSPGLLGGEAHGDAKDLQALFARMIQVLALKPDALCTDFPEEVREMSISKKLHPSLKQ